MVGSEQVVMQDRPLVSEAAPQPIKRLRVRLDNVDLLRGLVMVIMALDHVRHFTSNAHFDPTDLKLTTPQLFFTRWITHFCAPIFVFLAGSSAYLSLDRLGNKKRLRQFLVTRGLWLIFLELTACHILWFYNFDFSLLIGQVIWAIGWSMILLSGAIFLSPRLVGSMGLIIIAGHNLLDAVKPESFGAFGWLWAVLHSFAILEPIKGIHFVPLYALLPWFGVMAAGYGFGSLLKLDPARRRQQLLRIGLAGLALFFILRASNLYGDPQRWQQQSSFIYTLLSFFNCQKYPPSLLYLLMTLSPAICLLPLLESARGSIARFFITFGRVPLFYYLLHIPLIHLLAIMLIYFQRGEAQVLFQNFIEMPAGYGYNLPVVYLVWIVVVLLLLPLCRWFADVKQRRTDAWLSYL